MPLMIWVSRSCPKLGNCKLNMLSCWRKRKKPYAEYRRSREEMRELLAAKANVDRLMSMEEERLKDKDKDQEKNR